MNRRIRRFVLCLVAAVFMAAVMPVQAITAFAATAKITFNDPSAAVGTEFTVTVKAATTDGRMGEADIVLSYDPAVIEFISGNNADGGAGTVRLVGTSDSADTKSFDFSLKFKALQAGETTISVSSSELYDSDGQTITVSHSGNSAVKLQAPATYSSEASLSSLKISPGSLTPAFSPDVTSYTASVGENVNKIAVSAERSDPKSKLVVSGDSNLKNGENTVVCRVTAEDGKTVKDYTITVTKGAGGETQENGESTGQTEPAVAGDLKVQVDDSEYSVAASFDPSLLPEGYSVSSTVCRDTEVMSGTNGDLTLLYLLDSNGEGSFWFYISEPEKFTPYANIHVSEKDITVLPIDDSVEIPDGFSETVIQLNGDCKVEGWVWSADKEQRYCVFYGMNENGEKGLYRYDIGEKTIQRYFEDPAIQGSYSDEEVEAYISEFNEIYRQYRLHLVIIVALGVVCVILLVMVIVLLKKKAAGPNEKEENSGRGPKGGPSVRRSGESSGQSVSRRKAEEFRETPPARIPAGRRENIREGSENRQLRARREEAVSRERSSQPYERPGRSRTMEEEQRGSRQEYRRTERPSQPHRASGSYSERNYPDKNYPDKSRTEREYGKREYPDRRSMEREHAGRERPEMARAERRQREREYPKDTNVRNRGEYQRSGSSRPERRQRQDEIEFLDWDE